MTSTATDARTMITNRLADMAGGDLEAFRATCHPEATNGASGEQPPDTRVPGPEGFHASALWLRGMFSDLRWDVHEAIAQDDLLAASVTMRGRHTGPLTRYSPEGERVADVPATGREFAVTQTHWYRVRDGLICEHWMNHDALGMLVQLGMVNR